MNGHREKAELMQSMSGAVRGARLAREKRMPYKKQKKGKQKGQKNA